MAEFQKLYQPIAKEHFSDCFEISENGTFIMDDNNQVTRKQLIRHLNDNVLQNIDKKVMGLKKYHNEYLHPADRKKKDPLLFLKKDEIANDLVENKSIKEQNKMFNHSLDKILATHRNSKLFLFMLSGPLFYLPFMIIKSLIKIFILTHLYRKR